MSQRARHVLEAAKSMNIELKPDQLPIQGVYRAQSCAIAIQYNMPDNQVDMRNMCSPHRDALFNVFVSGSSTANDFTKS
jgi:hypothetical protein